MHPVSLMRERHIKQKTENTWKILAAVTYRTDSWPGFRTVSSERDRSLDRSRQTLGTDNSVLRRAWIL